MQSRTTFFLAILVLSLGAVIAILDRGAPDEAEPAASQDASTKGLVAAIKALRKD